MSDPADPTLHAEQPTSVEDADRGPATATNDAVTEQPDVDLGAIERDLAAVEAALPRLDDGSYWIDEVTGDPIPDHVLADDPVARRS